MRCFKCKKKIRNKEIHEVFQLTLGNIKSGKFHGEKTLYFHMDELITAKPVM